MPTPRPLLLSLLTLALAAGALAQPSPAPQPSAFSEIVDVRVVNLEVVVTDRDGVPVRGLDAGDFTLLVDGEEVTIDYFSEVLGGRTVRPLEGTEAEVVPGLREVVPGGRVGTSYLLFIDNFFSLPTDRNRVLQALADNIFLGPEDRMAIVSFDGRNLEMLSTWSQDDVELRRVINRSLRDPAYGLQRLSERRQFDFDRVLQASADLLAAVSLGEDFDDRTQRDFLLPNERHYVTRLSEQVERTVAAATATLRSFAMPPGRKVMLLLSGGWPLLPAEYLLNDNDPGRYIFDRALLSGEPLFRPLVDTANLLGYTLYPVDVPGLSSEAINAEIGGTRALDVVGSTSLSSSFLRETGLHATLRYLARETGGKPMLNADRMRALENVVQDTRSYYWLGFTPDRDWDDRRHDVEVRTSNPKLKLRARQGYLDSSRRREASMAVESALLFGSPVTEELLQIGFGDPQPAGRGRIVVPIQVLVPLDRLTFLPTGETLQADTEVRVAVLDEKGGRSDIPVIPIVFRYPEEPGAGTFGRYLTNLKMRRMGHRVVVAIHDLASGRILSAGADFDY